MKFKIIISLLLAFSLNSYVFSQEKKNEVTAPETPKEKQLEKKLGKRLYRIPQFAHKTMLFIKQPSKWTGTDWLKLGIVTAATFAVMPFDEQITNSTQGEQRYYNSVPIVGGRVYGEWYAIGGVASVFGVYGLIAKDTAAKKITIELLQAGLYSEIITTVLKVAIGRKRPVVTEDAFSLSLIHISEPTRPY